MNNNSSLGCARANENKTSTTSAVPPLIQHQPLPTQHKNSQETTPAPVQKRHAEPQTTFQIPYAVPCATLPEPAQYCEIQHQERYHQEVPVTQFSFTEQRNRLPFPQAALEVNVQTQMQSTQNISADTCNIPTMSNDFDLSLDPGEWLSFLQTQYPSNPADPESNSETNVASNRDRKT